MRNIKQLHPDLQKKLTLFRDKCAKSGLKVGIGECFRTVAEQDALYAQGRTKPGKIVTNARGSTYSSMHQWGVAFDIYRNDGKGAYNTSGRFFEKCGEIGKSVGLLWGGDWKNFKDMPHFQLAKWGSTTAILKSKYGNPTNFIKTWEDGSLTMIAKDVKYRVSKDNLWLRNKPQKVTKPIATMPRDAIFTSMGEEENGFTKGMYGKKVGWASNKHLVKA